MELNEAIYARHSVRAYLSAPAPKETITALLELARWAPNGADIQNWRVAVVQGAALEAWRSALAVRLAERPWKPEDIEAFNQHCRSVGWGQVEAEAGAPYDAMRPGSLRFYGAPAAVVVSFVGKPDARTPMDVPGFVTTFMLAACQAGLGTCWLGFVQGNADLVRQYAQLAPDEQPVAVLSLGYPDWDAPINRLRTPRTPPEAWTRWVE